MYGWNNIIWVEREIVCVHVCVCVFCPWLIGQKTALNSMCHLVNLAGHYKSYQYAFKTL
jgi:hypothetical protein